jgi:hypothetical protein
MNYATAVFLFGITERLSLDADVYMRRSSDANTAAILRQASWSIENSIPPQHRTTYLLEKMEANRIGDCPSCG